MDNEIVKNDGYTVFLQAVKENNEKLVRYLVEEVSLNTKAKLYNGYSALMICVENSGLKLFKYLVEEA